MYIFKPIPNDVSQYGIIDLLKLTTCVAIAVVAYPTAPFTTICAIIFVVGHGLLMASDSIDNRTIYERGALSQLLSAVGGVMLVFSASFVVAWIVWLLIVSFVAGIKDVFLF